MAQPVDILHQEAPEDGFIWTWTSQEFPMAQVGYHTTNTRVSHTILSTVILYL